MKPTILLTGKTGQVGSELQRLLPRLGQVVAPDRHELDLLDPDKIRQAVRDIRPQLIVNAAAYTAVDTAETDEANARVINAEAPAVFAEEARKLRAALVHYSTDYVFDGSKRTPYHETDSPNPINVYGKTKLDGELAIRSSGVAHLVFRTAWVYATQGSNFLLTILRLATERAELRIVCDQAGAPTCARNVATATTTILSQLLGQDDFASAFSEVSGTYHMTASNVTTWYDFASTILEEAGDVAGNVHWFTAATNGRPLITNRIIPVTTEAYGSRTPRPAYSVLSNSLLKQTFDVALPDWRTQLRRCFGTPTHNAPALAEHVS